MPESPTKPFSGIFVSYRRDDSAGHAGRLFDRLNAHFGDEQIFMDIDYIEPGEDFVQVIENAVGSCEILIAIIGRHWLSRRLDNPDDFVRLEIAAALNRDIGVIPVLVHGASMPKQQDLPDDLSKLSRRNALDLSDRRWPRDVDQLIGALEKILKQREEARKRRPLDEEKRRRAADAQRQADEKVLAKEEALLRDEAEARMKAAEEAARRRAEAEARLAEAEARIQADQEASARAETEAQRLAEEFRLRAEEESRRRAEVEARLKEEETRLRATVEEEEQRLAEAVRLRAEEESRRRAEVEARLREEVRLLTKEQEASARLISEEDLSKALGETFQVQQGVPKPNQKSGELTKGIDTDLEEIGIVSAADDPEIPSELRKRLSSLKANEREAALAEVARIGGDDAFRCISRAFDDQSADVRNAAAQALFDLQADHAATFTRVLREGSPERRRKIGQALAASGLAKEAICNLTGESREKTFDAFALLFLMAKADEFQPLIEAIEDHPNVEVRVAAIKLLAVSGKPEILPIFRSMAVRGSIPAEVRSAVMEAIYQIGIDQREATPSLESE